MEFCIFLVLFSFVIQILALALSKSRWLRLAPLVLFPLFFLSYAAYHAVEKVDDFVFGWESNIIFCLWFAGAAALGCGLAWLVWAVRKEK